MTGASPRTRPYAGAMELELEFDGEVIHWRGPSPYWFVPVPDAEAAALRTASSLVSYGWGVIPATVLLGRTRFTTSLFPRDGGYVVPLKVAVRRAERVELGDRVHLAMLIEP